jgi:hypothetical protein
MSAFSQSTWYRQSSKSGQNNLAIPLITGALSHRGLVPSRPRFNAPKGSLDGWPRCNTMRLEGNGKCHAIRE